MVNSKSVLSSTWERCHQPGLPEISQDVVLLQLWSDYCLRDRNTESPVTHWPSVLFKWIIHVLSFPDSMFKCRHLVFCDKNDVFWVLIFSLTVGLVVLDHQNLGTFIHLFCLFHSSACFIADMSLCRRYYPSMKPLHGSIGSHVLCLLTWLCAIADHGNYLQYS